MPKKVKRQKKVTPTWAKSCPAETQELQESAFFKSNILSNPLLVFEIFNHLSVSDLLSCSLVCKKWNAVSREILRRHRGTYLRFSSIDGIRSLESLLELIDNPILNNNHPFNGVSFGFCDAHFHIFNKKFKTTQKTKAKTLELLAEIYERIKVKGIILNVSQFYIRSPSLVKMALDVCPSMTEWFMPILQGHFRDFVDTNRVSMIKKMEICGDISSEEASLIEEASPILRELKIPSNFQLYGILFTECLTRIIVSNVPSLKVFHFPSIETFKKFYQTEEFPTLVNVRLIHIRDRSFLKPESIDAIIDSPGYRRIFPNVKLPWTQTLS
ncbi:unnamed protein product [Allacma fusca]|uniref:F-box domain-containing protein n=1 Tax=Allacma fusca TaxID=39272 RepID=A0A8J2LDC3_9HEXA|nr:unnamed protein product [Allacma fusca]